MINKRIINLKSDIYAKYVSVYSNLSVAAKAVILYFHGGGLLYGHRDDLPQYHLQEFCNAGYIIAAFDYPLAPAAKIPEIINDVEASIRIYSEQPFTISFPPLPYFLWGRSAGAYLCLLAASHSFVTPPLGIISYYGYGFLTDYWYNQPSPYYCRFPTVSEKCIEDCSRVITAAGELDTCYSRYVYARQKGNWIGQFYDDREKYFYQNYSLRSAQDFSLSQAVFLAHSTNDTDVPYEEFLALCDFLKHSEKYIVSEAVHDFDRNTDTRSAKELLAKTIRFLDNALKLY